MGDFADLIKEKIEALRPKLQDTTRRNPLINNVLSARSASFIRIVDEKPQSIFDLIEIEAQTMELVPLPAVDIDPPDEDTAEFRNAFQSAQALDELYLNTISAINFDFDENAIDALENADRKLKDRVRELLEMPPRPKAEQLADLVNHAKAHGINPSSQLPLPGAVAEDGRHEDSQLQTLLLPKTFQSRLARILSKAKMYREERGLDVVYIALGYLKWTLPNTDKKDEFKSPLLLLPVTLTKSKSRLGERYSVQRLSDPIFNPSLLHVLTVKADLDLSELTNLLEAEHLNVEHFFEAVADLQPKNMHWVVLREASFGVFPFQGIELYYDLDTADCDFSTFPVVSEIMLGKGDDGEGSSAEFSEADVETEIGQKLVPNLVMDADSSQFISLLKVANGQNVALEGPPGSGKSQTIVNAIANAISNGKKVLFVAQKATALEVVLSRLESLGLNQLVLPLMGDHGASENFYNALENRLGSNPTAQPQELKAIRLQLEKERQNLEAYISLITSVLPGTGLPVHQVMGLAIANANTLRELPYSLMNSKLMPQALTEFTEIADIERLCSTITEWCEQLHSSSIPESSIWNVSNIENLSAKKLNESLASLQTLVDKHQYLCSQIEPDFAQGLNILLRWSRSEILNHCDNLINNKWASIVYEKIDELGDNLFDENLSALHNDSWERYNIAESLSIEKDDTAKLFQSMSSLLQLKQFCTRYNLKTLDNEIVQNSKIHYQDSLKTLTRISELKYLLSNGVAVDVQVEHISYFKFLNNIDMPVSGIRSLIRELGILGTLDEVRKAKSLVRRKSQIFASRKIPSHQDLRDISDTISNAGLFSFLSKNYKLAIDRTSNLLFGVTSRTQKSNILAKLADAIALASDWERLAISDIVEFGDEDTEIYLATILDICDEINIIVKNTAFSEVEILRLFGFEHLNELHALLNGLDRDLSDWLSIERAASQRKDELDFIANIEEPCSEAITLLLEIGVSSIEGLNDCLDQSDRLKQSFEKRETALTILGDRFVDDEDFSEIYDVWNRSYVHLEESEVHFLSRSEATSRLAILEEILSTSEELERLFDELFDDEEAGSESINSLYGKASTGLQDKGSLSGVVSRQAIRDEAEELGLQYVVEQLEPHVASGTHAQFAKAWVVKSLKDLAEAEFGAKLLRFDGQSLSSSRKRLQQHDRELIKVARREVAAKAVASANPPSGRSFGRKSEYTDMAVLVHELQKKRRTPPRKILKRATAALMELFPCWMMVPSAVAQHLPRTTLFDLVIIDEASQMTPENSISALMRAKNALIAGDTNQLPPTNFFKGLASDEDEDEDVATPEESVLELANIQFHPKHRLRWHYRSKHEDLIAFSNHYVYNSELVIFPSPSPTREGLGISLQQINGTFQRGINPAEAEAMRAAISEFMANNPTRSLGVAVMNQSQMEQIEALMEREASVNKAVSDYIDYWGSKKGGLEKFFVKNLENVQGDERDVIFVGTVYGKDPQGKFYQRFGPINGSAGKRRLNVLFSRAKEQIVTFSSIPLAEFNPSTSNEGASLLKRWLEFSATKRLGEIVHANDRAGYTDSPFEDHVIEAIRSLGYEAIPQVGVSSYFIDIGVKHSSYPFGYICGVECDGATYHSSKSARDRDRLREEVLNRLGWNLHRIWSTDWFRDPLGCREILKEYLAAKLSELSQNAPKQSVPQITKQVARQNAPSLRPAPAAPVQKISSRQTDEQPDPAAPQIEVGTKFIIRYLDGPRAGVAAKLLLQDLPISALPDDGEYKNIKSDSPLGQELDGAEVNEIVSYRVKDQDIKVQVIEIQPTD